MAGNCLLRLVSKLTELVGISAPKTDLWARIRKDFLQVRLHHDSEQAVSAAGTRCQHTLWLCQPMCAAACVPESQRLTRAWVCAKQTQLTASTVMQRLCLGEFRPPTAWHDVLDLGRSLLERFQQDYQDPDDFPLPATVCPPSCCRSMVAGGSLQPGMCASLGWLLTLLRHRAHPVRPPTIRWLVWWEPDCQLRLWHVVLWHVSPAKDVHVSGPCCGRDGGPPKVRTLHALACLMRQRDCRL